MKKLLLALGLCLLPSLAWAQNPTCPTRPAGDSTNACANTAFTTGAIATAVGINAPIVILFTGQSNPVQTQTYSWTPAPNCHVWNWDGVDGHVGTAFVAPANTTIRGPDRFCSQVAARYPSRQVYLVDIGIASQAIAQWLPGAAAPDMFANITANIVPALAAANATKIDFFAWWQGEADAIASTPQMTYIADWEIVYKRLRWADYPTDVTPQTWFPSQTPVAIFGISNAAQSGVAWSDTIRDALKIIETSSPDLRRFVDPETFVGFPFWADNYHLGGLGYDTVGAMSANEIMDGVGRRVDDLTVSKGSGLQVNGGMDVQQFNASGALATGVRTYIVDQWVAKFVRAATLAISANMFSAAGAPFYPQSQNILRLTASTGLTPLAAGDYVYVEHPIEGYRTASVGFGLTSGTPLTVSFWLTGQSGATVTLAVLNNAANRTYLVNIPTTAGNAFYSVVIPPDTTGTWTYDNTIGIRLRWCFGAGATFQGTNGVWQAGEFCGTSTTTNAFAATNNLVQITGLSAVDTGGRAITVAQSNRMARGLVDELVLSQRYYRLNGAALANLYTNNTANIAIPFHPMRATPVPTIVAGTGAIHDPVGAANCNVTAISALTGGTDGLNINVTHSCAVAGRIGELAPETIALDARLP